MLIVKDNPKGIDKLIQDYQKYFHDSLGWSDYKSHGRCYRNKVDNGYIAEIYVGDGEYKDIMLDDSLAALSFFGTGYKLADTADVHMIFFINLDKIKPGIAHRADEEIRQDLLSIARENMYGFKYVSTEIGIENALKEYTQSIQDLPTADMHPWHVVRLNFKIRLDNNFC